MHLDMLAADHHHHNPSRPPHSTTNGNCPTLQMSLTILGSLLRQRSLSPSLLKGDKTELFNDGSEAAPTPIADPRMKPDPGVHNSPAASRRTSISSGTSTERPRKRSARPKTTYKLAQPPHPRGGKLHIRPKVVLQLHQVVASRRPKPAYEVIPYTIFIPFSTRYKCRTYRGKSLTACDLLILKAEEYQHNEEDKSDEERFGSREVLGVICPGKEDKNGATKTEILMANGQSWEVTRTPNGGYEFLHVDDHGLTLRSRWVMKPPHLRRQSNMSNGSHSSPTEDRKFTFSTISQNSRRHPIIATMTRDRIEVSDSYMMPSATSPPTPSVPSSTITPVATPSSIDMNSFFDIDRLPIETDDALRSFIVASGIWVAFQENWSPAYSVHAKWVPPPLLTSSTFRTPPNRTVSMTYIDSPRSASPASMTEENKRTLPSIIRSHTQFLHGKTSDSGSLLSSPIKTRSRRSNSTGNTDLFRNGSLRKRFGLTFEDHPMPETEEESQTKPSIELVQVKELALLPPPKLFVDHNPLSPIPSIEPPVSPVEPQPSPKFSDSRTRKTRSAYDPVTTAGMWDSGVVEGKGTLRTRPTSLVVMNDKKAKAKRKEKKQKVTRSKSEGLRNLFAGIFRKEKHST
ncbi:hypothetical protein BU23DRAFT_298280 [Bimuria novae-zelandiae CBS 107.79]|uniref:Uncharacterized protein n=1 Tax=Bimuria novae-zelandiae CBS 107.79 TaxID=1447943 RepID=A0A6A5VM07_9PLEO|nr:hypothetical protein BU23DRAFT_298280 [Bimuria novae-zelandiae CBS 107.79]